MMPSNLMAQSALDAANTQHSVFPNLATHDVTPDEVAYVTATAEAELKAAGINVEILPIQLGGEVPSLAIGSLSGWVFERRWYYWAAHGPGIPCEIAEKLHATHGTEVRVEGHCGCPSPRVWRKGFAIGSYHIDTQEGLNTLAATLRSIYDASQDPNAKPYMGGV